MLYSRKGKTNWDALNSRPAYPNNSWPCVGGKNGSEISTIGREIFGRKNAHERMNVKIPTKRKEENALAMQDKIYKKIALIFCLNNAKKLSL